MTRCSTPQPRPPTGAARHATRAVTPRRLPLGRTCREEEHPMTSKLARTAALVTGASSGIGAAVALVARRRDRLEALAAEIDQAGGTALVLEADITDRTQAEAAVQQTVEQFGRLDTLVNNADLMLLGPVVGADT